MHGEVKTPPFSPEARIEAGVLPHSRPMPVIGPRCHELRVQDHDATWRIVYRQDPDAVVIAEVFSKKTRATPGSVIDACQRRLRLYDQLSREREDDR